MCGRFLFGMMRTWKIITTKLDFVFVGANN